VAAKVVVTISGGNVSGVFTDNPNMEVYLVDYDNLEVEPNEDSLCVNMSETPPLW